MQIINRRSVVVAYNYTTIPARCQGLNSGLLLTCRRNWNRLFGNLNLRPALAFKFRLFSALNVFRIPLVIVQFPVLELVLKIREVVIVVERDCCAAEENSS